jgi:hypothetical protein
LRRNEDHGTAACYAVRRCRGVLCVLDRTGLFVAACVRNTAARAAIEAASKTLDKYQRRDERSDHGRDNLVHRHHSINMNPEGAPEARMLSFAPPGKMRRRRVRRGCRLRRPLDLSRAGPVPATGPEGFPPLALGHQINYAFRNGRMLYVTKSPRGFGVACDRLQLPSIPDPD